LGPPVLLNLVRSRACIDAWISSASPAGGWSIVRLPLAALDAAIFPGRDALLADWSALGGARDIGTVWPAFWRVFWATLPAPQEAAPAAMPGRTVPLAAPAATAAHPRAFRGTKFRPPKPAETTLDLHAWMADDRLLDGFFARHDFARWPVLGPGGAPMSFGTGTEPAPTVARLLAHGADMPVAFRRHFLWRLRNRSASDRVAWLGLWRAVGAPSRGELLAAMARLCAIDTAAHGWAALALHLPPARQAMFLVRVLAHASCRLPPERINAAQLATFDAIADDDAQFDGFIDIALDNLNRGVSIAYTLIGCQLPGAGSSLHGLRASVDCADVPVADIARMLAAVGETGTHWARSAWESCAAQPGYARILQETHWEKLDSATAHWWLDLFRVSAWDVADPALRAAQSRVRLGMFPYFQHQLLGLPAERQEKFVRMLYDYACGWTNPATLQQSWPLLLPLQVTLCQPPCSPHAAGDSGLAAMAMHLGSAGWQQLGALPARSWRAIARACRRDNDATLIRYGLEALAKALPDFLLHTLASAPKRLMRSMSLLGCLEYNGRRRFLADAARTPWFASAWSDMDPMDACRSLLALCTEYGVDSPLPRRLRQHFAGVSTLNAVQLARHCRVTLARLPMARLAALDTMAWRHIDGRFQLRAQSPAADHAVRLYAGIDGGNKKTLRRVLLDHARGGAPSFLAHPLNRAWHARHPRIDAATWSGAGAWSIAIDGGVRIAIETDPLEVLMLGSYVGSCLGLGGICEYSAVACLVDANKQVAYARDAAGRVVARQLLAIDTRDRLVCFAVYPAILLPAFREFDERLAQALGVEVYRDDGDGYDVEIILANEWWDDGAWDGAVPHS
jgi:hypothetical protein